MSAVEIIYQIYIYICVPVENWYVPGVESSHDICIKNLYRPLRQRYRRYEYRIVPQEVHRGPFESSTRGTYILLLYTTHYRM